MGEEVDGIKCENISKLTFSDNSIDLFVTQDVLEHVMDPFVAFKEICRVLKPGGAHIFTTPWYKNLDKSKARVRLVDGALQYLESPIYHGNPIDTNGSLVTYDYRLDFVELIYLESGLVTTFFLEYNRKKGLDAELLEVFVSRKI